MPLNASVRVLRPALIGVVAAVAATTLWAVLPGRPTFRTFDAPALGQAESELWRAYYERRFLRLASGLIWADHDAFGLSPWDSLQSGLSAASAARTFQKSRSRVEAQAALPQLIRHFAVLAQATHASFDPKTAAQLEIEWWQQRRETDVGPEAYAPAIAAAAGYLYGLAPSSLARFSQLRAEAMDQRDRLGARIEDKDWLAITSRLQRAYAALRAELATAKETVPPAP